jgi:hypothetical protein
MKNNVLKILAPLIIMLTLSSCSGIKVTTDYDRKVDFKKYKTFDFSKDVVNVRLSDLNIRRLKDDITAQMADKGYKNSTKPDLLVNVHITGSPKYSANAYSNGWGGPWGYHYGWGSSNTYVDVDRYTEGTMFIDLIDVKKKEVVWEGIAQGLVNPRTEMKESQLKDVVKRIFKGFPY